jgi:putative molybdopterin biosynthesis protein
VLLDHELARIGADGAGILGYEREEFTHLAVAAAVASGRADCGLGILAAARAFDLDFVPVATEPYDLVIAEMIPLVEPLLELLADTAFRAEVAGLGGYDVNEMGRRVR